MGWRKILCATAAAAILPVAPAQAEERVLLDSEIIARLPIESPLGDADPAPGVWTYQTFDPKKVPAPTRYEIGEDEGGRFLRATSDGGASLFFLKFAEPVNLEETPFLIFDWRIDEAPTAGPEESTKEGDDFAFRIYLSRGGWTSSKTLNIVRSRALAVGETWPSPYGLYDNFLHKVRMRSFAAADGDDGQWRRASVNVAEWWRDIFGSDPVIEGVGFMADSDNAGGRVVTRFREIKLATTPEHAGI